MAVLQKILVPLLAVNDTTLSVIEVNFKSKDFVNKGDVLMVFETSKTTFEVIAETDGYVKIYCEVGKDYDVNEVAIEIYDLAEEITIEQIKNIHAQPDVVQPNVEVKLNFQGSTMYSIAAEKLMIDHQIKAVVFEGFDLVTVKDINSYLYPGLKEEVQ